MSDFGRQIIDPIRKAIGEASELITNMAIKGAAYYELERVIDYSASLISLARHDRGDDLIPKLLEKRNEYYNIGELEKKYL